MNIQTAETQPQIIDQVLRLFEAGDAAIMSHIAADIDFRIDHYKDETDVSWQRAQGIAEFGALLQRLGTEVFPQGTRILGLQTTALCDGWAVTRFEQEFFYALRGHRVHSVTYITSHQTEGKMDFFREVVTTVDDI